jgi:subtilisin family serine protease
MTHHPYRSAALLSVLLLAAIFAPALLVAARTADQPPMAGWTSRVDPALLRTEGTVDFLVVLREQADLSGAAEMGSKAARGAYVYRRLTEVAVRSQTGLLRDLTAAGAAYRPFWVRNMVWVHGDRALLTRLASRPDVAYIYANTAQRVAPDLPPAQGANLPAAAGAVLPNLERINAPDAWDAGYLGQGAVVGGQDTGYDWTHPALKDAYRGWDGATADHDYNWHDAIHEDNPNTAPGNPCGLDSAEPCDDQVHGTHTMGTMVGDPPDAEPIGVAPEARWIGCRNMEEGWGTPATYSECFEWFIAPYPIGGDKFTDGDPSRAPDVINNSWSCPPSEGCTSPDILKAVVEAVTAAGIVTVQSAGNSGSSCGSVSTPAAIYDASFTVAATELDDSIAGFSSRGPAPGGLLKPDIAAPGTNVFSSFPGEDYGYLSGTSMAGPHVAGLVALVVSARPALAGDVAGLESAITGTARPLTTGEGCGGDTPSSVPNHTFGWGRIDAWAAVQDGPGLDFEAYMPFAVTAP